MGIKNISTLLNKYCSFDSTPISHYRNKTIAIDASTYLYSSLYCQRQDSNFLNYFVQQLAILLEHRIVPVYVFDGEPDQQKKDLTISKRREKKNAARNKITTLKQQIGKTESDKNIYRQIFKEKKKAISVTQVHENQLQQLLKLCGIPYVVSNIEADPFLAWIVKQGIADLVFTSDSDILVFGASKIVRGYSNQKNKCKLIEWDLDTILSELNLNYHQFVSCCVLMGTDNLKSQPGMGPITSYKLVKQQEFETTIRDRFGDEYFSQFIKERNRFLSDGVESLTNETKSGSTFKRTKCNLSELQAFCTASSVNPVHFSRLEKTLTSVERKITDFFS